MAHRRFPTLSPRPFTLTLNPKAPCTIAVVSNRGRGCQQGVGESWRGGVHILLTRATSTGQKMEIPAHQGPSMVKGTGVTEGRGSAGRL